MLFDIKMRTNKMFSLIILCATQNPIPIIPYTNNALQLRIFQFSYASLFDCIQPPLARPAFTSSTLHI